MRAHHQFEVVKPQELLRDWGEVLRATTTLAGAPVLPLMPQPELARTKLLHRVVPENVYNDLLRLCCLPRGRDVPHPTHRIDVFERHRGPRYATVHNEDRLVQHCHQWHRLIAGDEQLHELLRVLQAVLAVYLRLEAVLRVNAGVLVVAAVDEDKRRKCTHKGEDVQNYLHAVRSTVNKVAVEDKVPLLVWQVAREGKHLEKILHLAMEVANDNNVTLLWNCHALHKRARGENGDCTRDDAHRRGELYYRPRRRRLRHRLELRNGDATPRFPNCGCSCRGCC
ncbi:hypothetical protein DQ04_09451010 [Trypanosoma grayi]|uniref:hypothetical protein n=1 Tax=Trypanosoma grayi TaxID=71804 RepID=UPI0004F4B460|nr:hypothetical protein DQ04_09451010 [Trypanosoma grayi]KEG07555.1 hypothetical protein DQ04_09451010 [Trypanosoma grayi]